MPARMRRGMVLSAARGAALLAVVLCAVAAVPVAAQLECTSVVRTLDLSGTAVRESIKAVVNNKGAHKALTYQMFLPANGSLASLTVTVNDAVATPKPTIPSTKDGFREYILTFDTPLEPGAQRTIVTNAIYTHVTEPLPRAIGQSDRQLLIHRGLLHAYSPYVAAKAKTVVVLPTPTVVESRTDDGNSALSGNKLTYGPYASVDAFSTSPLVVHYQHTSPQIVVERLKRIIELSFWGNNMAVEDHYRVFNSGAGLRELFSRQEHQMKQYRNELQHSSAAHLFSFKLPYEATDVYYNDAIGNVSTSALRYDRSRQAAVLELTPRYPVYGGWHAAWFHGYNTPLSSFLGVTAGGSYCLTVPLLSTLTDAVIDSFELHVRLPEGATNVQLHGTQFESESHTRTPSYLDYAGRVTLIVTKRDLVNEHDVPVQVTFDLPTRSMLVEPVLLIVFFFSLFAVSMIYVRLDLSLAQDPQRERRRHIERVLALAATVGVLAERAESAEVTAAHEAAEHIKKLHVVAAAGNQSDDVQSAVNAVIEAAEELITAAVVDEAATASPDKKRVKKRPADGAVAAAHAKLQQTCERLGRLAN